MTTPHRATTTMSGHENEYEDQCGGQEGAAPEDQCAEQDLEPQGSLDDSVAHLFAELEATIDECALAIDGLSNLLASIERDGEDCFDEEDVAWIENELTALGKRKTEFEEQLAAKRQLYEDTVLRLRRTLAVRKQLLENADNASGVLRSRPNLLKCFAEKQAQLTTVLEGLESKLRDEEATA